MAKYKVYLITCNSEEMYADKNLEQEELYEKAEDEFNTVFTEVDRTVSIELIEENEME